jgi:hypothetical protein
MVSVSSKRTRFNYNFCEKVYVPSLLVFILYILAVLGRFFNVLKYFLFLWIVFSPFSSKAEQKDALNNIVLSAYLHLQSDGFLTTWTNSFVGPWDPSQGEHNPGNKLIITHVTCFFFYLIFPLMFGVSFFREYTARETPAVLAFIKLKRNKPKCFLQGPKQEARL